MRLFEKVPKEVWNAMNDHIDRDEYECADNCRAYRVHDNFLYAEFKEAEEEGCCGSHESRVVVDGDEWVYGFNYGH
jgi:hypothetical protein